MDIMIILWQFGILLAILIFGFILAIASRVSEFSKKLFYSICVSYAMGILILSIIASFYATQITEAIYMYNSVFYILMGIVMAVGGFLTIRDWKRPKDNRGFGSVAAMIIVSFCCFCSVVMGNVNVASECNINIFYLGIPTAIGLPIVMLISYFNSNGIIEFIKKPASIFLGNSMLFLGAYFLLAAFAIPNVVDALEKSSKGITIDSPETFAGALVLIIVLIIIGILLNRGSKSLLK